MTADMLVVATLVALLALLRLPSGGRHDEDDDDGPGGTRRRASVRVAVRSGRQGKGSE
jgi:hypothetical protein